MLLTLIIPLVAATPVIAPASTPPPVATTTTAAPAPVAPAPQKLDVLTPVRRFGFHIGLNATFTFDLQLHPWIYAGVSTQLTGLGAIGAPDRNFVVSALAFGGVSIPLVHSASVRLTADFTPMVSYFHAAPVNMLNVGLLGGLRVVHSSGFTFSLKLPLIGYAGSPDALRGGLLFYYTGAIVTVPIITLGYSF